LSLCRLGHAQNEPSPGPIMLCVFRPMWIGPAGSRHSVPHAAPRGRSWRKAGTYVTAATWTGKGLPPAIMVFCKILPI